MRRKAKMRRTVIAIAMFGIASICMVPKALAQGISPLSQQLSGSWFGELNIPNFPQLRVFMAYSPDGSILATSSNNPDLESHQFGAWVRTGDRLFSLTVVGFLFDGKGNYVGIRKIRATISLTAALNEFQGDGQADILDPAGNVVASIPALTVHGIRITVEPAVSQAASTSLQPAEKR
jgi:hypothetical protein